MMAELRLLSYNVRSLRDDAVAVGAVIRACEPDVVAVQEAPRFLRWRSKRAAMARRCGMVVATGPTGWLGAHDDSGCRRRADRFRAAAQDAAVAPARGGLGRPVTARCDRADRVGALLPRQGRTGWASAGRVVLAGCRGGGRGGVRGPAARHRG